jgi:quercetin dioxygenase-like cupin family protein
MSNDADSYFISEPAGTPAADGRFVRVSDVPTVTFMQGLDFQPILGEQVLVNHVHFAAQVEAPTHSHVEEQIVIMVEGELEFWIGDETRVMRQGDVAVIPAWVPHGGRTHDEPCLEIDIFCPPRRQLLEVLRPEAGDAGDAGDVAP